MADERRGSYPVGHDNPAIAAVIACLEDWFIALEDGFHVHRLPDPNYVRGNSRPLWTEEQLDAIVAGLDEELDQEVGRLPGTSTGSKAGPGFQRLDYLQRLALVQQLQTIIDEHYKELPDPAGIAYG